MKNILLKLKQVYWRIHRERWRLSLPRRYEHFLESRFERKYGLDTIRRVTLDNLRIDSNNRGYGRVYAASQIGPVRRALRRLAIRYEDYVFLDLGSGKGRVLLLAAELPFKRVIGVEFSPELNAIAASNIRRYPRRACADVSTICADAATFPIPTENCVIFLFRPFGEPVVEEVVRNLAAALATGRQTIIVIYSWPVERAPFDRCRLFRVRETRRDLVIYEARGAAA